MTLIVWQENRLWYKDAVYQKWGLSHAHRMVVIKLADGSLLIHDPIELTPQLQQDLRELGEIRCIVTASPSYHQYLSEWWLAYPLAQFFATPTLIQKRTDLNFDAALSNQTPDAWKGDLYQAAILGSNRPRKIVFCDPKSKTLLLSDHLLAAQAHLPIGQKLLVWAQGINQELRLPYAEKRDIKNMPQLRASIQEIMTWPFDRIISTNGLLIETQAKSHFYQAFWWAF